MRLKIRHRLAILFFGAVFAVFASVAVVSFAQSFEGWVTEGENFDNIVIGKSTEGDVIANYGADYKLIDHQKYSFEMFYKRLGLSFFYCQADPNKEIFTVEMEAPAKAVTSKGIKLGESSFADVFRLYGSGGSVYGDADYEGIVFSASEDHDGEDSEDARNQSQPVVREESIGETAIVSASTNPDRRDDMSQVVLDGVDVSDENGSETEDRPSVREPAADKEAKSKIVRRIELIEKDGLRQCESKFPKIK